MNEIIAYFGVIAAATAAIAALVHSIRQAVDDSGLIALFKKAP